MANRRQGKQSFIPEKPPVISAWARVAGKKDSEGPLKDTFDIKFNDTYFGQKTWEQGEGYMQKTALQTLANKAGFETQDFELVFLAICIYYLSVGRRCPACKAISTSGVSVE